MSDSLLKNWTPDDFGTLEKGVLLARHRLADTGKFTDEQLARILDNHPDDSLTISTMGHDTEKFEWREGDRNGVSGKDLLDLVRRGHLWINCRRVMQHHNDIREMVDSVYDELQNHARGFVAKQRTANLLISSPNALVHYHIDMPVNMLWHLRGRKRVWVYPFFDPRFVSARVVEMVCTGKFTDDVPYDPEFDRYALVFDVEPGQLLTWPQMAPHRVNNIEGLNVSLSTEHKNATAIRRINVYQANALLRKTIGWGYESTKVDGLRAHTKQTLIRAHRYLTKPFKSVAKPFTYPKTFAVDLTCEGGCRWYGDGNQPIVAPHEATEFAIARTK
jgi:hypothetical protein